MLSVWDVEMGERPSLILIVFTVVCITMMLPNAVWADTSLIRPETEVARTYYLNQGDVITWEWELIGEGHMDFWIEDSEGTRYMFVDNATKDRGSFVTSKSGEWSVKFYRDGPDPAWATVNHDIRINPPPDDLDWTAIIITTINIVVIVVFVLLMLRWRRKQVRLR
jgi:hypothetical protein